MRQSILGIFSLTLGIIGILFSCCGLFSLIPSIIGLIMGIVAMCDNKTSHGCAIGGIICNIVGILFSFMWFILQWFCSGVIQGFNSAIQ